VSSTSLTPDEFRAAAETHSELGPEYQSAVIDSFIDKVGKEIDARVDARMRAQQPGPYPAPYPVQFNGQLPVPKQPGNQRGTQFALAIVSMALGIPLTAIALGNHAGNLALFIIWLGITVINVAYALSSRPPSSSSS
jgi:hypothetical protein